MTNRRTYGQIREVLALDRKERRAYQNMLEKALKVKVEPYGLGAMSTERIREALKTAAIRQTRSVRNRIRFFVEVTGPIPHYIHPKDALSLIHAR